MNQMSQFPGPRRDYTLFLKYFEINCPKFFTDKYSIQTLRFESEYVGDYLIIKCFDTIDEHQIFRISFNVQNTDPLTISLSFTPGSSPIIFNIVDYHNDQQKFNDNIMAKINEWSAYYFDNFEFSRLKPKVPPQPSNVHATPTLANQATAGNSQQYQFCMSMQKFHNKVNIISLILHDLEIFYSNHQEKDRVNLLTQLDKIIEFLQPSFQPPA